MEAGHDGQFIKASSNRKGRPLHLALGGSIRGFDQGRPRWQILSKQIQWPFYQGRLVNHSQWPLYQSQWPAYQSQWPFYQGRPFLAKKEFRGKNLWV